MDMVKDEEASVAIITEPPVVLAGPNDLYYIADDDEKMVF
jgi:hypothetical protein